MIGKYEVLLHIPDQSEQANGQGINEAQHLLRSSPDATGAVEASRITHTMAQSAE